VAELVVITHEFDAFLMRDGPSGGVRSPYLLFDVLQILGSMGHRSRIVRGPIAPSADAALLHVDSTSVADDYLRLASNYAKPLNFRTGDISKRKVSRLLLAKGDQWDGPVVVKSNYNNNALMEDLHNRRARRLGRPAPHPNVQKGPPYRVLGSLEEVAAETWDDPSLVVERFIPEPDPEGGFVLRTWVFMGARERCTRSVTLDPISKAGDVIRYEPVEVPPALRAERERLGFDFGKFDFVLHDDQPILLDANRTPGSARALRSLMLKGAMNLAQGLDRLLRG
jgi:hypothetical protein